jgi:predicted ABC-type transport system involved in lysophospholipase L1 biosynthesis ATPase subunit
MPLIDIQAVTKGYGGLRPLRIQKLKVDAGELVTIAGPDRQAAAVLTDLLTGATLPDAGEVRVAGRSTADLSDHDDWLAFLAQFGIVNERVVLLDGLSVAENLAVPHTLELDPMPADLRCAVERMASEVGLVLPKVDERLSASSAVTRFRVRLGRALAHDPVILLVEHPSLGLAAEDVTAVADVLSRVGRVRHVATIVINSDRQLSNAIATRQLTWHPATGELVEVRGWRRWFM